MEIMQNADQNHPEHIPEVNNTTKILREWMDLNRDIPAGLFYRDTLAGVMHVNSKLLGYLKQEQMTISPVLEEFFWSRLESLAEDPEAAHASILEARGQVACGSEFRLQVRFRQ